MARQISAFEYLENTNSLLRFVGFNTVKPEDCIYNWYAKDLEQLTTEQLGRLRSLAFNEARKKDCSPKTRKHCEAIRERSTKIILTRALEAKYGKKS